MVEPPIDIEEIENITNEEKDIIKTFVRNRNSKEIRIVNKAKGDGKIYFEFFGLTYISYINSKFYIEKNICMSPL